MDNVWPKEIHVDWHHIHNWFVIPIPKKLHQRVGGSREKHRGECNNRASNILEMDLENIFLVDR